METKTARKNSIKWHQIFFCAFITCGISIPRLNSPLTLSQSSNADSWKLWFQVRNGNNGCMSLTKACKLRPPAHRHLELF